MSLSKSGPFSKEEEIFIIEEFIKQPREKKSPILVKRNFNKKFKQSRSKKALFGIDLKAFSRVYEKFKKNGVANSPNSGQVVKGANRTDPDKIKLIEDYFIQQPMDSLHQASINLDIPITTIDRILKTKIKMKPYKITLSQTLTAAHKEQRLKLCQWLLEQTDETISQIIFRDEKWFQINQHPNR